MPPTAVSSSESALKITIIWLYHKLLHFSWLHLGCFQLQVYIVVWCTFLSTNVPQHLNDFIRIDSQNWSYQVKSINTVHILGVCYTFCDIGPPWSFATKFAILFDNEHTLFQTSYFLRAVKLLLFMPCPALAELLHWRSWKVVVYGNGFRLLPKFSSFFLNERFCISCTPLVLFQSSKIVVLDNFMQFYHFFKRRIAEFFTILEILLSESSFNWNGESYILSEPWVENLSTSLMTYITLFFFLSWGQRS